MLIGHMTSASFQGWKREGQDKEARRLPMRAEWPDDHLFLTASPSPPLSHHLFLTASPSPPLSHHLFLTASPSPLSHHLFLTASPLPPLSHHLFLAAFK